MQRYSGGNSEPSCGVLDFESLCQSDAVHVVFDIHNSVGCGTKGGSLLIVGSPLRLSNG